jgi:hypothetical protein
MASVPRNFDNHQLRQAQVAVVPVPVPLPW